MLSLTDALQTLESNDVHLTAQFFVAMGEACVGLAGHGCTLGSSEQTRNMRTALDFIERGRLGASDPIAWRELTTDLLQHTNEPKISTGKVIVCS